ncbi:TDP-N-acetylfucosamine:lipid II N-acetylfucosaminyltransferase [Cyclobacterium sp. 1_MG-2023]|uniref:TDP-N-acetylfucosamine:lipid II N-acetylfucosaminyltransferase n=1 Tax=Cyclobacterium sp. 1_MG-2023 TaxID=3062681 RepID=UPI0026E2A6ED|nr:TDP-N-acetylfucosamine:lipid II N-acetylfucosaminyltransferase [Cyclobacterium sp. 1_MG-2023]MDO6439164.1 TDP-N-acetylfucosamine:lipid II N-acetylfucosaminyltransferase [Cyclobacterium sp. 1_MG-2023]
MIYHILNDEKFSDWVIESFKKFNGDENHRFFLVSNSKSSKYFNDPSVKFVSKYFFLNDFIPLDHDVVIFYFLHLHNISFLLKRKNLKCKKIWIGYGADYYYYLLNSTSFQSLYLKITQNLFYSFNGHFLFKRIALAIYQKIFLYGKVLPALKTLTHFAPIIPNEFSIIKDKYPSLNFDCIDFTFGDVSYLNQNNKFHKGENILLGNSATFSCNHIDILESINHLGITNKIVIPLSYGHAKYKDFLIDYIPKNYPNLNFEILGKFLPLNEYNQILNQCGFAIMPHLRQQGMGNIYSLLYSGTKLFLFKKNPVYEFLKGLGVCFYAIEDLMLNAKLLISPLAQDEMDQNRKIIINHYSKEKSFERIQKIVKL